MQNSPLDPVTDQISKAIYGGILDELVKVRDAGLYRAALILTLSGIDSMAYLSMPAQQDEVKRSDFIAWVDKYLGLAGGAGISGEEIYGFRCGMVHTYTANSKLHREGKVRMIVPMRGKLPKAVNDNIMPGIVGLSIEHFIQNFIDGVNRFVPDLFQDSTKHAVIENRLNRMMIVEAGITSEELKKWGF
ncbi:hypothetical protein BH09VER1_BH09VER1_54950 [soil metagenome]